MTGSSRPSANRGGSPGLVVIGCAREDAESLHEAMDALRRDELEVELCEGLDDDPKQLSDVIDRHEGRGLYVLCRSPQLGRERVEELREILLARHVPFARTLTVAVGGRGALADRIRAGLRRASARVSGPNRAVDAITRGVTLASEDEEPTLVGKREGVPEELELVQSQPLPLPPRLPRVPTPPPRPAEDSVVEAVEVLEIPAEELASEWSVPRIATDLDLSDLDNTGPTKSPAPGETTAPSSEPAVITGNTSVGPAPALITGDTVVGVKLPPSLREAAGRWPLPGPDGARAPSPYELEPATTPFPRMTPSNLAALGVNLGAASPSFAGSGATLPAPTSLPSPSPIALPPPSMRAMPTSLPAPSAASSSSPSFPAPSPSFSPGAAASSSPSFPAPSGAAASSSPSFPAPSGAAASSSPSFPGLASSSSPSFDAPSELELELEPEPDVSPRLAGPPALPLAPPPGPAPAAWASASTSAASLSDEPVDGRGKLLPWVLGAVALSLLVLVIALALSAKDGTAEVASGDEPAADDAPSSTPSPSEPTPGDGDEGDASADEASLPPGGVYPVVAALEARKVRALDVLLVATTWGKPSNYSAAAAYCEGLDVEGLKGWRLPAIGELYSLAQANMISRGMFWSSTSADTFGDGHMAWNARRGYALPFAADAVAVCVRGEGVSGS
jgi:hypothetical protein